MRMGRRRNGRVRCIPLLLVAGVTFLVTEPAAAQTGRAGDAPATSDRTEFDLLKAQVAAQQDQIDQLRRLLEAQARLIEGRFPPPPSGLDQATAKLDSQPRRSEDAKAEEGKPSPLRFRIGRVDITPVGFMDFTGVIRDGNVGSGISTNFGAVPFHDTVNGNLREYQFSAQNSRLGSRFDTTVKQAKVLGYLETDFLGIVPGNVAITANSDTLRLRLFWADVRRGSFEFLGGQSWSLLTPNRKGLSPLPGDLFLTQVLDPNLHVGLTWTRNPQLRFTYHPRETVHLGVSVEASEQYAGGASGSGTITLPVDLAPSYGSQLNTGSSNFAAPNPHQDVVAKIAFDPMVGNRPLHLEVGGVLTRFAFFNPLVNQHYDAVGGGGSVNINFEVVKNLRLVANTFYSDGAGRYIFGLGPDLIIQGDGSPSLVHSASTVDGLEYQATPKLALYGYYGGAWFQKNVAIDPADGKEVGFGYTGSPSNQNRSTQQWTLGFSHTVWRDPSHGGLQWGAQYSSLAREPGYVAPGQPGKAHLNMLFFNLRYLLPGAPPAPQK